MPENHFTVTWDATEADGPTDATLIQTDNGIEEGREHFEENRGVAFGKLTETLGRVEMRLNTCTIPPGDEGPYHKHDSQEEVYVLLDGPGHVNVDGDLADVPDGGVVRMPADAPRKFVNDTDEKQRWLVVGAPPVGTVDDMGEFVMVEE